MEKPEVVAQMIADTKALMEDGVLTLDDLIRNSSNGGYLLERAYEQLAAATAEIARLRKTLEAVERNRPIIEPTPHDPRNAQIAYAYWLAGEIVKKALESPQQP